jgi:hypothetical protein
MQSPSLVAKPAHLRSVWLLPGKSSTPTISENPETAVEPFKAVPWGNKDNECITSMYVFLPFPTFLLIGNKQRR